VNDREASTPLKAGNGGSRLLFLDNLRYLMIILVVMFHSVAAYAIIAPHWPVHDTSLFAASLIRELLDAFIMPVLFFAAGYFALPSLVKHGQWGFIKDKAKRLLIPWALAVFVILPLALYDQPVKPIRPFWKYWLNYLGSFHLQLRFAETPTGVTTQAVYWFISLLFAFFVVFALIQALMKGRHGRKESAPSVAAASTRSIITALLAFGGLTFATYFILLLLVPDSSWFTVYMFLEFQVTRLVPFAACFALGVFSQSHGWFAGRKLPGSWIARTGLSIVLAYAYLRFGQPVFKDVAGAAHFSIGYLLTFAIIRTWLLFAVLTTLVSFAYELWNKAGAAGKRLAAVSYDIYLVHFLVVVALQKALMKWAGGLAAAKIVIVFAAALAISYAFSRWILARHARAFVIFILILFAFCLAVRP
jgi:glucans biosynthesis protein C